MLYAILVQAPQIPPAYPAKGILVSMQMRMSVLLALMENTYQQLAQQMATLQPAVLALVAVTNALMVLQLLVLNATRTINTSTWIIFRNAKPAQQALYLILRAQAITLPSVVLLTATQHIIATRAVSPQIPPAFPAKRILVSMKLHMSVLPALMEHSYQQLAQQMATIQPAVLVLLVVTNALMVLQLLVLNAMRNINTSARIMIRNAKPAISAEQMKLLVIIQPPVALLSVILFVIASHALIWQMPPAFHANQVMLSFQLHYHAAFALLGRPQVQQQLAIENKRVFLVILVVYNVLAYRILLYYLYLRLQIFSFFG